MKKQKRTDRENVSLAKAEIELANNKEVQIANARYYLLIVEEILIAI